MSSFLERRFARPRGHLSGRSDRGGGRSRGGGQQHQNSESPQRQTPSLVQQGRGSSGTRGRASHRGQAQTASRSLTNQPGPECSQPIDRRNTSNPPAQSNISLPNSGGTSVEDPQLLRVDERDSVSHLKQACIHLATQLLHCEQRNLEVNVSPTNESSSPIMGTPVLDQFLQEVGRIIQRREGGRLQDTLQIEPPLPSAYQTIISELNNHFRRGSDQGLVARCERIIPTHDDGASAWGAFPDFLTRYFRFLRDADPSNLADLYEKLKSLTNQAVIALSHTSNGVIILPTVLYLSKVLAKVALGLDRNPDLVANVLNDQKTRDVEGATEKVTFVESSANVLREAFIKCLADMSGGAGRRGKPENKRTGVYMTANSCLKLLFQCRKLRNAQQMFVSINAQSPLLSYYPASQRVTYLYYLGRYLFANNHFYRAQLCLDSAYEQCHAQALRQRQIILTYLIASNICLSRFPSSKLLMRREAAELAKRFLPLCRTIARGDLAEFRRILSTASEEGQWFLRKRMLLQLRSTCEILVWRSLARKVFILSGYHPQGDDNKMPFLRLTNVQAAVRWLDQREAASMPQGSSGSARLGFVSLPASNDFHSAAYVDTEFEGMNAAIEETGFDIQTGEYNEQAQSDQEGANGLVFGEVGSNRMNDAAEEEATPTLGEIESIVASMLQQGLLRGFLTHTNPRFAISNSKAGGGALKTGFPNIWQTISARSSNTVPGWVTDSNAGSGLGGIVNISGARPAGG